MLQQLNIYLFCIICLVFVIVINEYVCILAMLFWICAICEVRCRVADQVSHIRICIV